jgi:hypothetical protein
MENEAEMRTTIREQEMLIRQLLDENGLLRDEVVQNAGMSAINNINNVSLDRQLSALRLSLREMERDNDRLRREKTSVLEQKITEIVERRRAADLHETTGY